MDNSNQLIRFILIGAGIALFLYAAGTFLIRFIIALIGLFLIIVGLSKGKSFFTLNRYRR